MRSHTVNFNPFKVKYYDIFRKSVPEVRTVPHNLGKIKINEGSVCKAMYVINLYRFISDRYSFYCEIFPVGRGRETDNQSQNVEGNLHALISATHSGDSATEQAVKTG